MSIVILNRQRTCHSEPTA